MPYEWTQPAATPSAPIAVLRAWPHRSLPPTGFVWFIGLSAALLGIPLIGLLGTPVLWGVLPFAALAIWGVWAALTRSYRDGDIVEELVLWPDRITLDRRSPTAAPQTWEAVPHWVKAQCHSDHKIASYVTLTGGGRVVELGAFLTPQERRSLHAELCAHLDHIRRAEH